MTNMRPSPAAPGGNAPEHPICHATESEAKQMLGHNVSRELRFIHYLLPYNAQEI
jgi:hypothetical protein